MLLYHCNNRSFKKSKALETKGDVSDRHSLQVTCESMYYVLNTHLTILAQQMGLQVQAFAVYLLWGVGSQSPEDFAFPPCPPVR